MLEIVQKFAKKDNNCTKKAKTIKNCLKKNKNKPSRQDMWFTETASLVNCLSRYLLFRIGSLSKNN